MKKDICPLLFLLSLAACASGGNTGGADSDAIDIFDAADAVESGEEEISVPETQTPSFEKGLIIPENSILCFPHNTDPPQYNCNHHGSTVIELPDKSIAAVWYHGVAEKSPDSRIIWSKWSPATGKWSQPEMLFDDPYRSEGNPALWVNEKGDFFLFFPSIYGGTWDTAKVRMIKSADGGKSWSEPVTLYDEYCWNARHEPLRLANGDILLPLYIECLALPSFIRSSDDFKTWTVHDELTPEYFLDHTGQIQPSLILLEDGIVAAITRDGLQTNRIKRMTSSDNGYTWTPSVPLGLPNSGTSVDWVRLMDGSVVVVFNNSPDSRFPLSAALSHDGGETFSAIRDVNAECPGGGCSYAYPSVTQSSLDGSIWVTYTHNRETIGYARFNEAWLAEGGEIANIRCLPEYKCVAGTCFLKCAEKYHCPEDEGCAAGACRKKCAEDNGCGGQGKCGQDGYCFPTFPADRVDVACSPSP